MPKAPIPSTTSRPLVSKCFTTPAIFNAVGTGVILTLFHAPFAATADKRVLPLLGVAIIFESMLIPDAGVRLRPSHGSGEVETINFQTTWSLVY